MSEPRDLVDLAGEPDRRYVSPVLAGSSQGRQRVWLACVLVLALGLPALVVTLGYNRPGETAAAAMPAPTTTDTSSDTTEAERATTPSTLEETTTAVEDSTTSAELATTSAPTYATSSSSSSSSTTAYAPTTTTTAYAYQAAQVASAPPPTAAPIVTTTTTAFVAPAPPPPGQGEGAFLACVRARESGGNYGVVSPDGLYRGAYQFHQATWDNVARMAGRPDLVGVPPNQAAPSDQDLLAVTLYRSAGAAPWGGYCG